MSRERNIQTRTIRHQLARRVEVIVETLAGLHARYRLMSIAPARASFIAVAFVLFIAPFSRVVGEQLTSPNFILDPNVANSFGGFSETGSYQLIDSGGEAAIGLGESGSYKLSSGYVAQLEQSIELNVLPEGLAAYYPLNTGLGIQAYDATPGSTHGVLNGTPGWTEGKIGQALDFNGDYVVAGDLGVGNEYTASAWINPAQVSGTGDADTFGFTIFASSPATTDGYPLWLAIRDSELRLWAYHDDATTGYVETSGLGIGTGEWVHVAATAVSGGETKLYVDGIEVLSFSNPGTSTWNNEFTVGDLRPGRDIPFVGKIDEVKVFDRILNEDEILDEYIANQQGISNALTLPRIGASQSRTVGAEAVVLTDAPGYELAISQDGNLRTEENDEIPPISGSIMFPEAWNEGVTTGFGFTITDAINRDGKWGSSPNFEYAAVPDVVSTFYSRDGLSGGAKEVTNLEFRLGVSGAQTAGVYTNRLGFTATIKP